MENIEMITFNTYNYFNMIAYFTPVTYQLPSATHHFLFQMKYY